MSDSFQAQLIEARRKMILDAAIEVIAEQGFQRTTIKQIAGKAGVADGTIYNYFDSKDDILTGIVARLSEEEIADMHQAEAEQLDFATFVETFVHLRMEEMEERYPVLKVVLPEMMSSAETAGRLFEQIHAPMYAVIESYFQRLIDDGQIEAIDPELSVRLFASPFMGLIMLRMMGDEHIAANWGRYEKALGRFLGKGFA